MDDAESFLCGMSHHEIMFSIKLPLEIGSNNLVISYITTSSDIVCNRTSHYISENRFLLSVETTVYLGVCTYVKHESQAFSGL